MGYSYAGEANYIGEESNTYGKERMVILTYHGLYWVGMAPATAE